MFDASALSSVIASGNSFFKPIIQRIVGDYIEIRFGKRRILDAKTRERNAQIADRILTICSFACGTEFKSLDDEKEIYKLGFEISASHRALSDLLLEYVELRKELCALIYPQKQFTRVTYSGVMPVIIDEKTREAQLKSVCDKLVETLGTLIVQAVMLKRENE